MSMSRRARTSPTGTTGSSCSLTTKFYTGDPRSYQAFVASRAGGFESDRQASSNSVNVARAPWSIGLAVYTQTAPDSNGRVDTVYQATANQNVGSTGDNYLIYIYDYPAKKVVSTCSTGTYSSRVCASDGSPGP